MYTLLDIHEYSDASSKLLAIRAHSLPSPRRRLTYHWRDFMKQLEMVIMGLLSGSQMGRENIGETYTRLSPAPTQDLNGAPCVMISSFDLGGVRPGMLTIWIACTGLFT